MNEKALITGASSGLGREYANQLAEKGYDLIITARRVDKLQEIANTLEEKYNSKVEVIPADLTVQEDLEEIVKVIEQTENYTLLINNAGFGIPKPFLRIPYQRHQDMIDLHVTAVTKLSYVSMKIFKDQNKGGIITVSSVAAFIGSGMYTGTKRFQVHLMKRLHKIAKDTPINIQAVCPGYTKTGFHLTDDYEGKDARGSIPSWLWLEPDYVVNYSLEKLQKGKVVVIPAIKYKLATFLGKLGLIGRR